MTHPDIERLVENLESLAPRGDLAVDEVRAADIAQALTDMDEQAKVLIISLLSDEKAADVLAETDEHSIEVLLAHISAERLIRLMGWMAPDDAADLLGLVPRERRGALLAGLEEDQRRSVSTLGDHPPESAGGIMTTEVIAVGSNEKIASALRKVGTAEEPEAINTVYVVDPAGTLVGVAPLTRLLTADPALPMHRVMDPDVISVEVDADQEEAARIVDHYHLPSIPVVDAAHRLQGVITVDDVIDVIGEEASEDMLRLAGTNVLHPTSEPTLKRLRARAPWLTVTLLGTFLASLLIEHIEKTYFHSGAEVGGTFSMLLYFIPLIGGMAGNVGTQSSTIMVRGFATGEVDPRRPMRVLRGELVLAVLIGLLAGVLVGILAGLAFTEEPMLGWIVGVALFCSVIVAAFAGTLIPFACHAIHVDPAYAGGPFLLTLNDLSAFVIYFTVALLLLNAFGVS